jgi:multiple sugar transport system ATP-binding protein
LYDKPANQFVAQFIGTPQMNIVSVADLTQLGNIPGIAAPVDGFVGLRPENVTLVPAGQGQFQAKIELVEALGAETLMYVTTMRGTQLVARQNTRTNLSINADVGINIDVATAHFFDAKGRVTTTA